MRTDSTLTRAAINRATEKDLASTARRATEKDLADVISLRIIIEIQTRPPPMTHHDIDRRFRLNDIRPTLHAILTSTLQSFSSILYEYVRSTVPE